MLSFSITVFNISNARQGVKNSKKKSSRNKWKCKRILKQYATFYKKYFKYFSIFDFSSLNGQSSTKHFNCDICQYFHFNGVAKFLNILRHSLVKLLEFNWIVSQAFKTIDKYAKNNFDALIRNLKFLLCIYIYLCISVHRDCPQWFYVLFFEFVLPNYNLFAFVLNAL